MNQIAILLHNIRSAHNVGSIFRTADAAGVATIFLTGYTPTPIDAYGRAQKDIAKTALGAEKSVEWSYFKTPATLLKKLKRDNWQIVGVEQVADSVDYRTFVLKKPALYILGNEVEGISKSLLKKCDAIIEIPMRGTVVRQAHHPRFTKRGKESLNVSVAAGIILFSVRNIDDSPRSIEKSNDIVLSPKRKRRMQKDAPRR